MTQRRRESRDKKCNIEGDCGGGGGEEGRRVGGYLWVFGMGLADGGKDMFIQVVIVLKMMINVDQEVLEINE